MSSTLGAPEARIGLVFTAFNLPVIFGLPFVGVVADLYGRKTVVVPGLILFGVAGAAVAITTDFWTILVLRGLQGIGYTRSTPSPSRCWGICSWAPRRVRPKVHVSS